jgi:Holliday junction resolvase RusA-like endonuclease
MIIFRFPSNAVEFALACSICINKGSHSQKCHLCKCEVESGFEAGIAPVRNNFFIKFTVPGVPVGKGRPRFTRTGHTYTPDKTAAYEEKVRLCWKTQTGSCFAGGIPLKASIIAYFPIPKSASKKKAAAMDGSFHTSRPDADNVAKAILDALNGYLYPDDSAVQIDRCWKVYTNGAPRVEVTIWEA